MSTVEDLELIRKLAHEIAMQAHGTKESERIWIAEAAAVIEPLASDGSTDEHRAKARELLNMLPHAPLGSPPP
jgi:hypothetical protein